MGFRNLLFSVKHSILRKSRYVGPCKIFLSLQLLIRKIQWIKIGIFNPNYVKKFVYLRRKLLCKSSYFLAFNHTFPWAIQSVLGGSDRTPSASCWADTLPPGGIVGPSTPPYYPGQAWAKRWMSGAIKLCSAYRWCILQLVILLHFSIIEILSVVWPILQAV